MECHVWVLSTAHLKKNDVIDWVIPGCDGGRQDYWVGFYTTVDGSEIPFTTTGGMVLKPSLKMGFQLPNLNWWTPDFWTINSSRGPALYVFTQLGESG